MPLFRRRVARRPGYRRKPAAASKPRYYRRGAAGRITRAMNPTPTFTESFALPRDNLIVTAGSGVGKAFKVSFNEIPQHPQYMNLYTQYRINWIKVMLLPQYDTNSADINSGTLAAGTAGMARIAWSIQNSPGETDPLTEAEVLRDNGAKVKSIGTKWQCSFKPVPDVAQTTSVGTILTKQRFKQWFNYDDTLTGNNPKHGAVTAYVSLPGLPGTDVSTVSYICYYKVNFSLRDPR